MAIVSDTGRDAVPWPSSEGRPDRAPVIFWGERLARGAELEPIGLDDIAPTLARLIDLEIPHPEVRSGRPVAGTGTGPQPTIVFEIVVRGVADPSSDPFLAALADRGASGDASIGSLPHDPAALLTTIGTGGRPAQHGITASLLRNDRARVARAWSSDARPAPPGSVIATLADDLDEVHGQRPHIGLVADTPAARGLVGGNWYFDNDRDAISIVPTARVVPALDRMLGDGFGRDEIPDLIGVSLRAGRAGDASAALHVLRVAQRHIGERIAAAIVALPRPPAAPSTFPAREVVRSVNTTLGVDAIEAETPGGFFLDQAVAAEAGISRSDVVAAMRRETADSDGNKVDRVFADVFPGLSVALARFC